jgi:hypothetical protein
VRRAALAAALVAAALGCGPRYPGPLMEPGNDCAGCHGGAGPAHHTWTMSGTIVFTASPSWDEDGVAGVKVTLEDDTGHAVTAWSNAAGNFYSAEAHGKPYTVRLERGAQTLVGVPNPTTGAHVDFADCNMCHGRENAKDKLGAPIPKLVVP